MAGRRTLYDKIIDRHKVMSINHVRGHGESLLLYVDRTVLNEYTSPQAFSGLRDAGRPFASAAALAKLTAGDAAMDNARDATQIFGGNGFMNEYPVARHYRDAKILEIGEGTTEVQLLVIARALGLTALPPVAAGPVA